MSERESSLQSIDEIRGILRRELPRLRQEYSVSSLEIFGSFVRGDQTPTSDVDLLVDFDETPSLFRFIQLEDELTAILHVKVDLVMKTGLKPTLGALILREALPV